MSSIGSACGQREEVLVKQTRGVAVGRGAASWGEGTARDVGASKGRGFSLCPEQTTLARKGGMRGDFQSPGRDGNL